MFEWKLGAWRDCTGITRRDVIRVGSVGLAGLTVADLLRAQAASATPKVGGPVGREVNCIFLWLVGGPSHHETFDPKPNAPAEVRGEFGVIPAKNGVQFCELLPRLAGQADQFSLVRSVTHSDSNHETAQYQVQSGYKFSVAMNYPSYGAVVARERGIRNGLPPYMLFAGRGSGAEGAGYFGAVYNPFTISGDPSSKEFSVRDVSPPGDVDGGRFERRQRMLAALDRFHRRAEVQTKLAGSIDQFLARAYDLITSPAAKKAFALSEEKDATRERYGRTSFGQSCLLARRLVEAGVRFVTVSNGGWDTHQNNFRQLKGELLPRLDQSYSALLADLSERGLLDSTLVICMGEFGRTPGVNSQAGRDHWPSVFSACLGGGGVRTGLVVGKSDDTGAMPAERPVKVEDLAATIYKALGIDSDKEYMTPQGRPTPIVYNGEPVMELL
jgi:uncharacterized protein DUF1501